jgi:alpha-mannosidase
MIGNAHLDPAWMWQWDEGMEAFIATCRAALDRMRETPGFIFTCSSAAHYRWIEEVEPELFEQIRMRVLEGRWEIVGGWWVQADCNLPSGEGFVRQALLGQRYFMEKFGRRAHTGYSPDAFGHSRGLPQLLMRAGMNNYIFCRPDPTELLLPSPLFSWQGDDGSEVLAYRVPFHYNMYESSVPKKVADLLAAYDAPSALASGGRPLRDFCSQWTLFYGVGNHGGGPTREHIRNVIEIDGDPDRPATIFSRLDTFFGAVREEWSSQGRRLPVRSDDLQLNAPGCYSAHSQIKKLNRSSEYSLIAAERFCSLASILLGVSYPLHDFRRAWENVCFNHFHDILCGVAIREALDDAIGLYGEALSVARRSSRHALQRIARAIDTSGAGETLIIFNPHSWDLSTHVTFELWHDIDKALWSQPVHLRVTTDDGDELVHQMEFPSGKIGRDRIAATFRADLPALGWRSYRVFYGEQSKSSGAVSGGAQNNDQLLENDLLRIEFSAETGSISRILHKASRGELLSGPAALPIAIDDPTDTWGHGVSKFDRVIGTFGDAELKLVENGPTHATVRSRSRWRNSWVQQDFRLYHDSDIIHVSVKLFWGEEHVMLKLGFTANVRNPEGVFESAYCSVRKPSDGIERPGGAWAAVVDAGQRELHGVGIVNDAKHGYSVDGPTLCMTVLRSSGYAIHDPHMLDPDEDLDFLDQGIQRFEYLIVPLAGDPTQSDLYREAALLNAPPVTHFESTHVLTAEALARAYRGIEVSPENVQTTVLKRSEEEGGWIVRAFEMNGIQTDATFELHPLQQRWHAPLRPHEVRTFLVTAGSVVEVDLIEVER